MKCLSDDSICHNGNDKNDPQYNKYQIIQSNNDYSCTQLSAIGFNADLLKTEFDEDRIRAAAEESDLSVTMANTRERQEALPKEQRTVRSFMSLGVSISTRTTCLSPQRWEIGRGKSRRWKKI